MLVLPDLFSSFLYNTAHNIKIQSDFFKYRQDKIQIISVFCQASRFTRIN